MRKMMLGGAAIATLLLAWFAPDEDNLVVAQASANTRPAVAGVANMATVAEPAAATPLVSTPMIAPALRIHSRNDDSDEDPGNLFTGGAAAQTSTLKPAAARAAQAASDSGAAAGAGAGAGAAQPIAYLGRYTDNGKSAFLLQADGQDIVARVGDALPGGYRLDAASDSALTITHLATHQTTTLATGEAN